MLAKNFITELYPQHKENVHILFKLVFITILPVMDATLIRQLTFEVVQLVECLLSKHKVQNLNPSTI